MHKTQLKIFFIESFDYLSTFRVCGLSLKSFVFIAVVIAETNIMILKIALKCEWTPLRVVFDGAGLNIKRNKHVPLKFKVFDTTVCMPRIETAFPRS